MHWRTSRLLHDEEHALVLQKLDSFLLALTVMLVLASAPRGENASGLANVLLGYLNTIFDIKYLLVACNYITYTLFF